MIESNLRETAHSAQGKKYKVPFSFSAAFLVLFDDRECEILLGVHGFQTVSES